MQEFKILTFKTAQDATRYKNQHDLLNELKTPLWRNDNYIAYPYQKETFDNWINNENIKAQLDELNAHWLTFNRKALDYFVNHLYPNFKPTSFTTKNHIEYPGDELLINPKEAANVSIFETSTDEVIQSIKFRNQDEHHQSIVIDKNGVVGFHHINVSNMNQIFSQLVPEILRQSKTYTK